MMADALKPCPFCGANEWFDDEADGRPYIVLPHDDDCFESFGGRPEMWLDPQNAEEVRRWNHRPAEDALSAESADLKRKLHNLHEYVVYDAELKEDDE